MRAHIFSIQALRIHITLLSATVHYEIVNDTSILPIKLLIFNTLDVRNQCSGFIYSLSVADQFIKTGMYKKIE